MSLHAALVLGVGFSSDLNLDRSPTIEVTLAVSSDPEAPEDADFLAATNQIGSGDAEEVMEMTSATEAEFQANRAAGDPARPAAARRSATRSERLAAHHAGAGGRCR